MTYEQTAWTLQTKQAEEGRRLRRGACFVGVSLLAMLLFQVLAGLFLGSFLVNAEAVMSDSVTNRLIYYAIYIGFYCLSIVIPVAITALFFRRSPLPPKSDRRAFHAGDTLLLLVFGMAFCMLANYLVSYWLQFVSIFGIEPYDGGYNNDPGILPLCLNLLTYAVMPGVLEELVFRGWFLGTLRPFGEQRALLLSALIFGLMHGNLTQVPFAFMLGLLFGFIFLKTGRLWHCMVIHTLNNALSVVLDYLSKNTGLSENTYLTWQVAVMAGIAIVGAVAGLILYHRRSAAVLISPVVDRRSVVPEAKKAQWMWFSPVVIISLVALTVVMIFGEVAPK